jgi:hypothetical protein
MSSVFELTVTSLRQFGCPSFSVYEQALAAACTREPPPFGRRSYGETYRRIAANPDWMIYSLATSAEREGDGASRLWSLAACTSNGDVSGQVKRHALDEARHARWYLRMMDLTFPGAVDASFRDELNKLSPKYSSRDEPEPLPGSIYSHAVTLDDLIQMNIAEIRTALHHRLQRPMLLAHTPPAHRAQVESLLAPLLRDEVAHVAYTASLIEQRAEAGEADRVMALMTDRMRDFNAITDAELANHVFESS